MVISSLNINRITDLIGFIKECLNEMRTFHGISQEEFLRQIRKFINAYIKEK